MNDLELEEIESHLYSQIYHSNEGIEQDLGTLSLENLQKPENNMKKPNRYFQNGPKNTGSKFQNRFVLATQPNLKSSVPNDFDQTQGIYSKDYARPHKRDISINQLVVFSPQQTPIVCVSNPNSNRQKKLKWKVAKWRAKSREKRRNRKLAKLGILQSNDVDKANKNVECDIITVSDSDGESCVEIPNDWPLVSVTDSDDEVRNALKDEQIKESNNITTKNDENLSETLTDDVIFVEPVNVPIEIINLDEEVDNRVQKSCDDVNTHADVETSSVTSSNNSFLINYSPNKSKVVNSFHQERKELLDTPDSASNDFMNNSGVELNQTNFNFSLHGSDFKNDKFLRPAVPTETCETESSSSTTDMNALNSIKTIVFNEIEFPKDDIFADANLESFGNFITPLRKQTARDTGVQSSTPTDKVSSVQDESVYSSDSSSESDFDEPIVDKQKDLLRKSKNLPDLSPMHSDNEKNSPKAVKKNKKVINLSSKFNLILNTTSSESVTKKSKQKKRKSANSVNRELNSSKKKSKNKKRKTDDVNKSSMVLSSVEVNAIADTTEENSAIEKSSSKLEDCNGEAVENDIKQKKRKSGQFLEDANENSENNQSKKKIKMKKKKNVAGTESDDIADVEASVVPQKNETEEIEPTAPPSDSVVATFNKVDIKIEQTKKNPVNSKDSFETEQDKLVKTSVDATPDVKSEESEDKITEIVTDDLKKEKPNDDDLKNIQELQPTADEDVILIESSGKENEPHIISSDSESNLSSFDAQDDIQLINCEVPHLQNCSSLSSSTHQPKYVADLTNHTLEEVQRTMSSDPKLWAILDSDRMPARMDNRGRRCNKCRERGHMAIRCPNKVVPKCSLCGESGHFEPRCPNRICTQCGERSPYSTTICKFCFKFRNHQCQICFMTGHSANTCPDMWRRYHLTTTEGPLISYDGPILKPSNRLWCSGCARSGHLEYTCRFFKSVYPPSDPHIKSYEDVYQHSLHPGPGEQAQQVNLPLYFGVDQFGGNYLAPPMANQQPVFPFSYNQSNNFVMDSFPNHQFRTMYPQNGAFINNVGSFFGHGSGDVYLPRRADVVPNRNNQAAQNQDRNQFCFEDNLPNFISFDTAAPNNNNYNQMASEGQYYNGQNNDSAPDAVVNNKFKKGTVRQHRQIKQNGAVFFSSPAENIQQFLNSELNHLFRLGCRIQDTVKNLKKIHLEPNGRRNNYYKTLNMVLFGIYKLNDGEKHLVKLKTFKMKQLKAKLSQERRQDLYRSYCYIFGIGRHGGVDYNKLLRRL